MSVQDKKRPVKIVRDKNAHQLYTQEKDHIRIVQDKNAYHRTKRGLSKQGMR